MKNRGLLLPDQIDSTEAFADFIGAQPLAAVYFSQPNCGICEVLKPKLMEMFNERFPELVIAEVDCSRHRSLAAQQGVFAVPTLIVFFEGREGIRKARAFGLGEVESELARPYAVFTGD